MIDRRGFIASLLAAPVAGMAVRNASGPPMMQTGPSDYDAFCLAMEPARDGWREHGVIHLLKAGDPYPDGFEGWVAFAWAEAAISSTLEHAPQVHASAQGRCGIRWGGGDQKRYQLEALGEPVFNDNERCLTFTPQAACQALVDLRNRRRQGFGYYGVHYRRV